MTTEVLRSPGLERGASGQPALRPACAGTPCVPSLADVPTSPSTWSCSASPTRALADQLAAGRRAGATAARWCSAPRTGHARRAGRAPPSRAWRCAAPGCMGFVNVARGVRALGYLERGAAAARRRSPWSPTRARCSPRCCAPTGGLGLLASRSRPGRSSSPTTADYLDYALDDAGDPRRRRCCWRRCGTCRGCGAALADAAERDVPVVALTGRRLAARARDWSPRTPGRWPASDAAWEALFAAYGVHRCADLAELADTLELFAVGRRVRTTGAAGSRPCTTRAPSGPWSPTSPTSSASRSPTLSTPTRAPARRRCSTPGWSRPTRSTCGAPAPTPRTCSPPA